MKCYPNMYKKNILTINYDKLKKSGIKCLLFDLDNTICLIDENKIKEEYKKKIISLEKDFKVVIISNNTKSRVEKFSKELNCDYISNSLKPLKKGYKKIKNKYNLEYIEMCIIGDQLITDILGGNILGLTTVLVDPLASKDLKITKFNRIIERIIFNRYKKKNIMRKGVYYE